MGYFVKSTREVQVKLVDRVTIVKELSDYLEKLKEICEARPVTPKSVLRAPYEVVLNKVGNNGIS